MRHLWAVYFFVLLFANTYLASQNEDGLWWVYVICAGICLINLMFYTREEMN